MVPEVKVKWLEALRNGTYKQGRKTLKSGESFCCLGVLTDLYIKEMGKGKWDERDYFVTPVEGAKAFLPACVQEWAGVPRSPNVPSDEKEYLPLTMLNDGYDGTSPASFPEIANLIEKHL